MAMTSRKSLEAGKKTSEGSPTEKRMEENCENLVLY